jgi:hypothetical protein
MRRDLTVIGQDDPLSPKRKKETKSDALDFATLNVSPRYRGNFVYKHSGTDSCLREYPVKDSENLTRQLWFFCMIHSDIACICSVQSVSDCLVRSESKALKSEL